MDEYTTSRGEKVKLWECPCCSYPTLTELNSYEICYLCKWEDDGQGDKDADLVKGGPNKDYSLSEARLNFRQYLIMYRPLDDLFCRSRNHRIDEIKREIISAFNSLDEGGEETLLTNIDNLKELLKREEMILLEKLDRT